MGKYLDECNNIFGRNPIGGSFDSNERFVALRNILQFQARQTAVLLEKMDELLEMSRKDVIGHKPSTEPVREPRRFDHR